MIEVKGSFSSNSSAILTQAALDTVGIIKVPRYTVRTQLAKGKLKPIFEDIMHSQEWMMHSQERMRAYYSKTKYLPTKTIAFIELLQTAMKSQD